MYREHPFSEVGLALRYLREQRDLVQQDVADKLGINKASVSRLEQPRGNPTTNSVGHYLRVLGASVQDLADAISVLKHGPDEAPERTRDGDGPESAPEDQEVKPALEELQSAREEGAKSSSAKEKEVDPDLLEFYRREFVGLHERLAVLEARLKKDD